MPARLVSVALLALAWFGFANAASAGEAIAAISVTLIGIAAFAAVRRDLDGVSRLRWAWKAVRTWPKNIILDGIEVFGGVARRRVPEGRFLTVDVAGRSEIEIAWTIMGISISPDAYVIGWDRERQVLLLHELIPSERTVWRPQ
jgi:multisubunit Na+/H+ antiporter MnhE subunit